MTSIPEECNRPWSPHERKGITFPGNKATPSEGMVIITLNCMPSVEPLAAITLLQNESQCLGQNAPALVMSKTIYLPGESF